MEDDVFLGGDWSVVGGGDDWSDWRLIVPSVMLLEPPF